MVFTWLRKLLCIPSLLSAYIMKGGGILFNVFSVSIEMVIFSSFYSINLVHHYSDCFSYVESILYSWDRYHWLMLCNAFYMLLDLIFFSFFEDFYI